MYWDDHNPPHFHAKYNEFEILIGINPITVLNGDIPNRAKSLVLEWAAIHQNELLNNWIRSKENLSISPIEPLI